MNTIYKAVDRSKNVLAQSSEYSDVIRWAFFESSRYQLIEIRTTYDYHIPSNRIVKFVFEKVQ